MPPEPTARAVKLGDKPPGRDGGARSPVLGSHGRYVIGEEIASGGMATVHLGRMVGDAGFARTVAIKRLHPQYANDPDVCAMLLDEGRLAARIHHLNVVTTLDVVASQGDLFVVMEYVHGEPLSVLIRAALRRGQRVPPRIGAAVLAGALRGLHAAHEARDARGEPLGVVHRDISPQNILVGSDGVARVLDFGIAKAAGRAHVTQDGRIKGKFGYMPPEQLHGEVLDRRADIYAAGVVLWETLVGARLYAGRGNTPDFARLLQAAVDPPSSRVPLLHPAYDAVVLRALAREAQNRWSTALKMAEALEASGPVAPPAEVGAWVTDVAGDLLAELSGRIAAIETRLVSGIRDSLHLIETSESRITRLDALDTLRSNPPGATAILAKLPPAAAGQEGGLPPAPREVPSEPPPPDGRPAATGVATGDLQTPSSETRFRPEAVPARGSAALWTGVAAIGAVAIAATFAVIASVPAPPAVTPSEAQPSGTASAEPAAPPVEAAPTATEAASAAAPAASASGAPSGEPAKSPASAAPAPPPRARTVSAPPPPPRRPAGDGCSPPFTIDAAGHKHYKRECLK